MADSTPMTRPTVSVSLVTYNGMRWLPRCLETVMDQSLPPLEILVVDNASTDGSREWLEDRAKEDPRISVEASATNLGYASAHNRNLARCSGDHVLLLNQDVELAPGFLDASVAVLGDRPGVAAVQGRLLQLTQNGQQTNVIDTTGLIMARDRRVGCRGQGEPDGPAFARPGPVWGADGPAPVFRRAALLDARMPNGRGAWEVLDEDFYMWKEDVDLAWRLRRLGWEAWYEPSAVAWHARGTGGVVSQSWIVSARSYRAVTPLARVLSWRNQRLSQVKNDERSVVVRDLPWIVRRELVSLALTVVLDPYRLRAIPLTLRALPGAMRKRRWLQRRLRDRSGSPWVR
jgi:GT2 family glycosyltransferase